MNSAFAQNLTSVAVGLLAWSLAYIALAGRRFARLGREALLCASCYVGITAVSRTLGINGIIETETSRMIVGVSAFAALAVLAQLAWLKRLDTQIRKNGGT